MKLVLSVMLILALGACKEGTNSGKDIEEQALEPQSLNTLVDTSKAYTQAISTYLKAIQKINKQNFDTLYLGNPDSLKCLKLPEYIAGKRVILFTPDMERKKIQNTPSFVFINLCWGNFERDPIEFMFYTFYAGFTPQYQTYIYLRNDKRKAEFVPVKFVHLNSNGKVLDTK